MKVVRFLSEPPNALPGPTLACLTMIWLLICNVPGNPWRKRSVPWVARFRSQALVRKEEHHLMSPP